MPTFCHQCAVDKHFSMCRRRCQLGEFKSTSAESRQNGSDVVCDCPASTPVTFLCLIVCRRPCDSGKIRTGSGHSHRRRPVNVDTMYKGRCRGGLVLCVICVRSADLYRRSLYTCWLSGWFCHGLTLAMPCWWHSSLSNAPSAVGVELVSTAHLSAETLRPRY